MHIDKMNQSGYYTIEQKMDRIPKGQIVSVFSEANIMAMGCFVFWQTVRSFAIAISSVVCQSSLILPCYWKPICHAGKNKCKSVSVRCL